MELRWIHRPEGPGVSPLRDLPRSASVGVREAELCGRCTQALRGGAGLPALLRRRAQVATPTPIGPGVVDVEAGSILLFEAVPERLPHARTPEDWRSIGHTLASLHQVHAEQFGRELFDGYFGPLPQDNRPVASGTWADFYTERRVLPRLRSAVDSGHLPSDVAVEVERLRWTECPVSAGQKPRPSLLHGDAQLNNFMSCASGAVVIDPAPYFGHPELDLALIEHFETVPKSVLEAYQEVLTIDPEFADRRVLWRIFSYLANCDRRGREPLRTEVPSPPHRSTT